MKTTATTLTLPRGPIATGLGVKFRILLLMTILCVFVSRLNSANRYEPEYDSLTCLEIEGKILVSDEDHSLNCMIELIGLDGKVERLILKENRRKFKLTLSRNSYYTIRISRPGYASKLIGVDTEVNEEADVIYNFKFETMLLKEEALVHLNKDAMDMPIAIIQFDSENDDFVYDKKYTESVKQKLRENKSFDKSSSLISTNSKMLAAAYTD
jgi:hypothetical protein